jgi:hypothetical protein
MLAGNTIWPKLAFKECQSMGKLVVQLTSFIRRRKFTEIDKVIKIQAEEDRMLAIDFK